VHAEAARRGLPNNRTTVDALPALSTARARELFARFGVLSERELASRRGHRLERYVKVQDIEASCALDIARHHDPGRRGHVPGATGGRVVLVTGGRLDPGAGRRAGGRLVDAIAALEHAQHAAHEGTSVQRRRRARSWTW